MATFSIADMGASMSTVYRRKVTQTQRKTPILRLLSMLGSLKQGNTGPNITWTPKFSGQAAGNPSLDGGAFITATSDQPVSASLAYGSIGAPAKLTDDIYWRGGPSAGISADYNTFNDMYNEQRLDAVGAALKLCEQQIFTGTGSANQFVGLSTACAASGTYATIAPGTYSQWASTVVANGGVLRSLTIPLMKQTVRVIATASKAGRPNIAVTTPALMDVIEGLFDPYLQIPIAPGAMTGPNAGPEKLVLNPGTVRTVGGNINMDGFRHFYWATAGVYFVESPDCTDTAQTNANNVIYFLNSDELELLYLEPPGPRMTLHDAGAAQAIEQTMGPIANLQFEEVPRGRVGYATEWDYTAKIGLKLTSRNAHGVLADVQ